MSYYIEVPKKYEEDLIDFLNKEFIPVADKLFNQEESCTIEKADFHGCSLDEIECAVAILGIFFNSDPNIYPVIEKYILELVKRFSTTKKADIKIRRDRIELKTEGYTADEVKSFIEEAKK